MRELQGFNDAGLLPPHDYEQTFSELRDSFLVNGEGSDSYRWNKEWRLRLIDNSELLVHQLWEIGIENVFIDGSFVEAKGHPNDIDGYFECEFSSFVSGEIQRELNKIDKHKVWTWDPKSRKPYRGYLKKQLPMWHVYRVELYPHYSENFSGIVDAQGNPLTFPSAFRSHRATGRAKGIVKLVKE